MIITISKIILVKNGMKWSQICFNITIQAGLPKEGFFLLKDLCKSCSYDIKKVVKGLNCYYGHLYGYL